MTAVLLTGMSANGKTAVLRELARRGQQVLDTDHDGWTRKVRCDDGSVDHQWDEPRMTALLAQQRRSTLFVSGCVSNQGRFYDRFDAVVLLSAPREVLLERIRSRTGGHGTAPGELERILADLHEVEPLLRRTATVEVDTRLPVHEVVDVVEALARR